MTSKPCFRFFTSLSLSASGTIGSWIHILRSGNSSERMSINQYKVFCLTQKMGWNNWSSSSPQVSVRSGKRNTNHICEWSWILRERYSFRANRTQIGCPRGAFVQSGPMRTIWGRVWSWINVLRGQLMISTFVRRRFVNGRRPQEFAQYLKVENRWLATTSVLNSSQKGGQIA